jgi:hypothetical protein
MIVHALGVEHTMNEQEALDELANAILLFRAPNNAGMRQARLVKRQIVGVERHNYTPVRCGEGQLVRIRQSAAPNLLNCQNIDAMPSQPLTRGTWKVLVH